MLFIKEYRVMIKKNLKIPSELIPILKYSDEELKQSFKFYYDKRQLEETKAKTMYSQTNNKTNYKAKFTNETLKRLYPTKTAFDDKEKTKQQEYFNSMEQFSRRLIYNFFLKQNAWTNDKTHLFDYWSNLSDDDRVKMILTILDKTKFSLG
jgi:hypothetical protein